MEEIKNLHTNVFEILEKLNKEDFFKFSRVISNKDNLALFKNFFSKLQVYYDENNKIKSQIKRPKIDITFINVKSFFSYYTVLYYPEVMNVKKDSVIGKNMISKGSTMRIYFLLVLNWIKDNMDKDIILSEENKFILRIGEFFKTYYEFINRFNEWKDLDRECLIFELIKTYYYLEKDFNELDFTNAENSKVLYDITKKNVNSEKEKTIDKIDIIDSKNGKEKFKNYTKLLEEKDRLDMKGEEFIDNLMVSIEGNIKKAYWDIMKEELEKEPPETLSLINNLKELKSLVVSCVNQKVELRKDINKVIDEELIEQMIRHNAYNYGDLENIVKYVNDLLWKFQAISEDDNTRQYEKELKEKMDNRENIIDVLIFFLSSVMPKFENILLIKYQIIKEIKKK